MQLGVSLTCAAYSGFCPAQLARHTGWLVALRAASMEQATLHLPAQPKS